MRRVVKDVILPVAVAIALAFVIQASVAKPYEIPTESMKPTIVANDRIIANRVIYRVRDIQRGDIIVFDPTPSAAESCGDTQGQGDIPFVKRVVGLPGDLVEVKAGVTLVNGEEFVVENSIPPNYEMTWERVPEDSLLVLGDNRAGSCDSHQWSPDPFVPRDNVIGQAEVTYWPPSSLKFLD
jgi:signal peptidase I